MNRWYANLKLAQIEPATLEAEPASSPNDGWYSNLKPNPTDTQPYNQQQTPLPQAGTSTPLEWKAASPDEFVKARTSAPSDMSAFLSDNEESDLANHTLLMSSDGKVGAAISPEGDIQNVFNNGGPKGAGREILFQAINKGGNTLDCYDGFLPQFYAQYGFVETGRVKFDPRFASPKWDYNRFGRPDIVFMRLMTHDERKSREILSQPKSNWPKQTSVPRYFSSWDEAKAFSRRT